MHCFNVVAVRCVTSLRKAHLKWYWRTGPEEESDLAWATYSNFRHFEPVSDRVVTSSRERAAPRHVHSASAVCSSPTRQTGRGAGLAKPTVLAYSERSVLMDKERYVLEAARSKTIIDQGGSEFLDISAKLVNLKSLFDQDIITQADFDKKKDEWLSRM